MTNAARLRNGLRFLFSFEGPVGGRSYLLTGCLLMLLKYAIDFTIVKSASGHSLTPLGFLVPLIGEHIRHVQDQSSALIALAFSGVFFLWIAVALTSRRALELGVSPVIAATLLLPLINLAVMVTLGLSSSPSSAPNRRPPSALEATEEADESLRPRFGRAILSGLVVECALYSLLAIGAGRLGAALFFFTPFAAGAVAGKLAFERRKRSFWQALRLAFLVNLAGVGMFLLLGLDGVLCLTIGMLITTPITLLGTVIGMLIANDAVITKKSYLASVTLLPLFLLNDELRDDTHEYVVLSSIEIAAQPEDIWPNLIEFGELGPPDHWIFDLGIAWPQRARIEGRGVGAVRYCEFSTGPFVEPIHTWDEPYVLGFDVSSQPPPMTETTPWTIHPVHLDGYIESVRGELRVVRLDDQRCRLEGRTWYRVDMWPTSLFRALAEFSIHRVHERVLKHIQTRTERS